MPKVGIKYCALYYLNQWLSKDRIFHESLTGIDERVKLEAVAQAAAFYGIARNLRERYDVGVGLKRYGPVISILDEQTPTAFEGTALVPWILDVSAKISSQYGGRKTLSLTTKLLWLKFKSPTSRVRRPGKTGASYTTR